MAGYRANRGMRHTRAAFAEISESRANALLTPGFTTEDDVRNAALVLAGNARNPGELRGWLEMCGMQPYSNRGRLTSTGRPARADITEKRGAAS